MRQIIRANRFVEETPRFDVNAKVNSKIETNYIAEIATRFTWNYKNIKTTAKKRCSHLVWYLIYVFKSKKQTVYFPKIEVSRESFNELNDSLPNYLPEAVS